MHDYQVLNLNSYESQYVNMVYQLLANGEKRKTRNGETRAIFGTDLNIAVSEEFPLLRGRKLFYKPVIGELAAMFRGPTNIEDFKKFGCNYWDEWGDMEGYLKLDYGNAWIDFNGVNQLEQLVNGMIKDPTGRRHIVSGWRPDRIPELSLPCCHLLYQFYIREGKYIDMIWYQRSADFMIGVPADVILGATWLHVLARELFLKTGIPYAPGNLKMVFGDTHIYGNHIEQAHQYLEQYNEFGQDITLVNTSKPFIASCLAESMSTFLPDQLEIENYDKGQYMPTIKFPLNV
jgi:thymidylate synthase